MKRILKKIFSYEPLIVWIRYFQTTSIKYSLLNFGLPIIACILLGVFAKETIITAKIDVLTISSILIGFCASILIMLFTLSGETAEKLNNQFIRKTGISLLNALILKFAFMIYNLVALVVMNLIINALNVTNLYCNLVSIGVMLNTFMILIEALSNAVFCLMPKKTSTGSKDNANK